MTIQRPDRAVRDYLAAFDLAAVFVVAPKAETPCGLGAGRQLPSTRRIAAAWWADSLQRAHDVVDLVLGRDLRLAPRAATC
jgi:hypothetical protein